MKLSSISTFQIVKHHVLSLGFLGVIAGILYSFGGLIIDALVTLELFETYETPGLSFGTVLAFGALIGMPLIGIGIGLVSGLAIAILHAVALKVLPRKCREKLLH